MQGYRADIDGLRAVAIVPVVLFHAGVPGFSGGFVGVDVFFVISGFLITQLLLHDLAAGRYSIVAFYERRVRRILPALFTMLGVVAIAASIVLLPDDLAAFGRSAVATSLFWSNVEFWQTSGYFARAAEESPLLHTWSLAVEEQFYIVFPLFLSLCDRGGRRTCVVVTSIVALCSLVASIHAVGSDRDLAFYLPHTRAWELALGALLAMQAVPTTHRASLRHLAGIAGVALIAFAVFRYDDTTPFPGLAALPPCLGTALIIWAGSGLHSHHVIGDLLARKPFVRVGLISYSLYLWHWPLLAFAAYLSFGSASALVRTAAVATATILAVVSWRYVERPFRGRSGWLDRRGIFSAAAVAMTVVVAFGLASQLGRGWPARLAPDVARLAAGRDDHPPLESVCFNATVDMARSGRLCRIGAARAPASFVVWGDSHARVVAGVIGEDAQRAGRAGLLATRSACAPLVGARRADHGPRRRCPEFSSAVLQTIIADPQLRDVVLVGRWGQLALGTPYKFERDKQVVLRDAQSPDPADGAENARVLQRTLASTVAQLRAAGRHVWILAPIPEVGWDVPGTLARARRYGRAHAPRIRIAPAGRPRHARSRPSRDRRAVAASGALALRFRAL
jgi:peptidoglycan/LPS O-acetylase OafA/YrhL